MIYALRPLKQAWIAILLSKFKWKLIRRDKGSHYVPLGTLAWAPISCQALQHVAKRKSNSQNCDAAGIWDDPVFIGTKGHKVVRTLVFINHTDIGKMAAACARQVVRKGLEKRVKHYCERDRTARFRLELMHNLLSSQFWEGIFPYSHATLSRDIILYLRPMMSKLIYLRSAATDK